jgi:hypothetical protein
MVGMLGSWLLNSFHAMQMSNFSWAAHESLDHPGVSVLG